MTTIFFHEGFVFADTEHHKGEVHDPEVFASLTKIQKLAKPLRIEYTEAQINEEDHLVPAIDINDTIHGWTCTGCNVTAREFINEIKRNYGGIEPRSWDLKQLTAFHKKAKMAHLVGFERLFTVVLIGEKGLYGFCNSDYDFGWTLFPGDDNFALGSGVKSVLTESLRHNDPLRAMYATMLSDENTSGMIDIWRLPTSEKPEFYRWGLCNVRTGDEIIALLNTPIEQPVVPDLLSRMAALQQAVRIINAHDAEEAAKLKAERKAARATVRKAPTPRVRPHGKKAPPKPAKSVTLKQFKQTRRKTP